jgi:hypothetical protein
VCLSALAILLAHQVLIPQKIAHFGIAFATPQHKVLLWLFLGVVTYYFFAFMAYGATDGLRHFLNLYRKRAALWEELRMAASASPVDPREKSTANTDARWRGSRWVPRIAFARLAFDYCVPLLIAGYAMWTPGTPPAIFRTDHPAWYGRPVRRSDCTSCPSVPRFATLVDHRGMASQLTARTVL